MDKQREQFEAWAKGQYTINKDDAGEYWNGFTQDAWEAWQAALSAQPSLDEQHLLAAKGALLALGYKWNGFHWENAQPSPGGQDALDCIGRIEEAIEFRVPHDIYAAVHGALAELKAALAARQPVGEPFAYGSSVGHQPIPASVYYPDSEACRELYDIPLYSAPPAQAVDLSQFRELVTALVDRCGDDLAPDQFMLAGRLLNLINSQA